MRPSPLHPRPTPRRQSAVTLLELMCVTAIILILATLTLRAAGPIHVWVYKVVRWHNINARAQEKLDAKGGDNLEDVPLWDEVNIEDYQ